MPPRRRAPRRPDATFRRHAKGAQSALDRIQAAASAPKETEPDWVLNLALHKLSKTPASDSFTLLGTAVEAVVQGAYPNKRGPGGGNTLLHYIALYLLDICEDANLSQPGYVSRWQLYLNNAAKKVEHLLGYGADPTVLNRDGKTPRSLVQNAIAALEKRTSEQELIGGLFTTMREIQQALLRPPVRSRAAVPSPGDGPR